MYLSNWEASDEQERRGGWDAGLQVVIDFGGVKCSKLWRNGIPTGIPAAFGDPAASEHLHLISRFTIRHILAHNSILTL